MSSIAPSVRRGAWENLGWSGLEVGGTRNITFSQIKRENDLSGEPGPTTLCTLCIGVSRSLSFLFSYYSLLWKMDFVEILRGT